MHGIATTNTAVRHSILETIGDTPLVALERLGAGLHARLVAKLEAFNPGGSIKDRVALALIEAAEQDGRLRPGGTIVEPTSGNTGTGLAIAARLRGYRVIAVMPDKMSKEKIDLLRAYGADVVVAPTDVPPDSPQSYYRVADRLTAEIPGAFQPNQYFNQANPQAHYASTGPEIWEQTAGQITHLVAGVGTGGTITGTARYLRERRADLVVVGADPEGSIYSGGADHVHPYLVEGVGEDFWPETFDPSVVDRWVTISDRDAFLATRRLAQAEGILAGGSGGLAVQAALQVAAETDDPEALIVVIVPDGGRSYLSKIFSDSWMRQYGFLERRREPDRGRCARAQARRARDPAAGLGGDALPRAGRGRAPARAPGLPAPGRERARSRHGGGGDLRARPAQARDRRPEPARGGDRGGDGAAAASGLEPRPRARCGRRAGRRATGAAGHRRRTAGGDRDARRPARSTRQVSESTSGARSATDGFATRAVHAGLEPDPSFGSVIPAIHQTSTYAQPRPGEFKEDYDYARSANPTRSALEKALGELEGGRAVCFSSGLAAEHALITVTCAAGVHMVLPSDLYGGTYRLAHNVLSRWGLRYDLVEQTELEALEAAVAEDTALIWVESPTNPLLNVVDIEGVVARRKNALVAVDSTFATPFNQRPLELGADFVVHSTTKYLGGHSDVVGGAVITRHDDWYERLRFVQNAVGAVPGPLDCFLVHRGLRTLHLRMPAHARSAAAVVELLKERPEATNVRWPGFSGMVSFRHPEATKLAAATRLFTLAESLGGVESLIEVPQAMTHQSVEGSAAAVPGDLVRLSCGVEAPEDLVADLRQALAAASEH